MNQRDKSRQTFAITPRTEAIAMGRDKTTKAEYLAMQIREEMERSGLNKLIDQINAVAAVTSVGGANDNLLVTYVDGIG